MVTKTSVDGIVSGSSDGRRALLADFDIEGSDLKPSHTEWLDGLVGIVRRSPLRPPDGMWVISITGRASKTGTDGYNAWLSDQRAHQAQAYVQARIGGLPVHWDLRALGESSPFADTIDENARDRSVEVHARPNITFPPPEIEPRRRKPVKEKVFDLVVDSFNVTVGEGVHLRIATWIINLVITAQATDISAQYVFEGSGSSAPIALTPFASDITSVAAGSMQPFSVEDRRMPDGRPIDETCFAGDAGLFLKLGSPNVFRFGGNKLTGRGTTLFPMGLIEPFTLPRATSAPPEFCTASGKMKRGFGHF